MHQDPADGRTARLTAPDPAGCPPAQRVTKSLLGYGVVVGPIYVLLSVAQALTRTGFDLARHDWSLLANGTGGWIQSTNLMLSGLMVIAFAVGLRRALTPATADRWAPRLVAGYGAGLIVAGIFRADPADGFPVGTPPGQGPLSWHGTLHMIAGGVGFTCVALACLVLARRYAAEGRPVWARWCTVTAVVFLAGFALVAAASGRRLSTVAFTAAVMLLWGWMSAVAADRYLLVSRAGVERASGWNPRPSSSTLSRDTSGTCPDPR